MKKFFIISLLILIFSVSACKNWLWKDKKGCEPNPCYGIEHATDVCEEEGWGGKDFSCVCEGNYLWDPRESEKKCVDPCESKPCDITGSTGLCIRRDYDEYKCECTDTYFWDKETSKCTNSCEPDPCKDISHATGVCESDDWDGGDGWQKRYYSCECEENYFWEEDTKKCINPCDSNPCGNTLHVENCIPKSAVKYKCICKTGSWWNGVKCVEMNEMNECSPGDSLPCKDSSTGLIWSSKYSDNQWHEKCKDLSEGNLSNWKTPSIGQLRTLIRNCPNTETNGTCEISDECYDEMCYSPESCKGCIANNDGKYSVIGDWEPFCSESSYAPETACFWAVNFGNGAIETICSKNYNDTKNIRCTRCLEDDYEWNGSECVKKP